MKESVFLSPLVSRIILVLSGSTPKGLMLFYIGLWIIYSLHDDIIKWKHFPRYWPFVWEMNSPYKGQ